MKKYSVTQRSLYVEEGIKKVRAILKMKKVHTQVDVWWAKKFCRELYSDPVVKIKKGLYWQNHNYKKWAQLHLQKLDIRFPDQEPKEKTMAKSTKKYSKRAKAIQSHRKSLKQARALYVAASNRYDYWFRKYNSCPLREPKWKEFNLKKDQCKEEVTKLAKEVKRYEKKLGLKHSSIGD